MLGDFNAFEDCSVENTCKKYTKLLEYAKDIVPPETKTFENITPIDHVLIKNCDKCGFEVTTPEELNHSDHKYLEIRITEIE